MYLLYMLHSTGDLKHLANFFLERINSHISLRICHACGIIGDSSWSIIFDRVSFHKLSYVPVDSQITFMPRSAGRGLGCIITSVLGENTSGFVRLHCVKSTRESIPAGIRVNPEPSPQSPLSLSPQSLPISSILFPFG
jgi:hypothetical protein